MKKLGFLLGLVLFTSVSFGQLKVLLSQYDNPTDTVTSTAAKYLTAPILNNGFQKVIIVAITATEISGTTAGTATLEASLDGSNWYSASTTAHTLTDVASQTFTWSLSDWGSLYLRVKVVGVSTPNVIISAKLLSRKENI